MSKEIKKERFDLFIIGARKSFVLNYIEEISYWSDLDENVIGFVGRCLCDNDFFYMIFLRDKLGCFRAVDQKVSISTEHRARVELRLKIFELSKREDLDDCGIQGDEVGHPVDLLKLPKGVREEDLNQYFCSLLKDDAWYPARIVLKEIGPWLTGLDKNFVSDFQRKQFDQRLWELYLWACFRGLNFSIEHYEAPDFLIEYQGERFAVEATTVAPSLRGVLYPPPPIKTDEDIKNFFSEYMPMKYAGPLCRKLEHKSSGKFYWEREDMRGIPFIIAIADFHSSGEEQGGSFINCTQGSLLSYLYGVSMEKRDIDGQEKLFFPQKREHSYKNLTTGECKNIESGFFKLKNSEHVSAVIFSNAGTIAKFCRMGVLAGHSAKGYKYFRDGIKSDPVSGNVFSFFENVESDEYFEEWGDEIQIFHNPNALNPICKKNPIEQMFYNTFSKFTEFFMDENGQVVGEDSKELIITSKTTILSMKQSRI